MGRYITITTQRPENPVLYSLINGVTGIEPSSCNIFESYQRRVRISDDEDTQRTAKKHFVGYLVNVLHQIEAKKGARC